MQCHVVTSFPDPGKALWAGVLEWVDETQRDREGRHPRILKVQCALRDSKNGPFLSMPSRQSSSGQYFDLVNIGAMFMDSGVSTVQAHLTSSPVGVAPAMAPFGAAPEPTPVPMPGPGFDPEAVERDFGKGF